MNHDYSGNELLPSSNLVTPQSHAGTSLASSRHVNTNPSTFGGLKNNLVATAPHNRNLSDSRYSNINTDGLTYSASAVSEVSENL